MWGEKRGQNNTDTVWSQVIHAITQTQEVSEENSMQYGGWVCKHSITYCVGSKTCKYFCGKNNTKSKMLLFVAKGELKDNFY